MYQPPHRTLPLTLEQAYENAVHAFVKEKHEPAYDKKFDICIYDAGNGKGCAIDGDDLTYNGRIKSKPLLPVRVTDYRDRVPAWCLVVLNCESSTEGGFDAQH